MSSTFFSKLRMAFAYSYYDTARKFNTYPEIVLMPVGHFGYVISTQNTDTVILTSKYVYTYGGYTRFMVVDERGKHYEVENSVWFWRWTAIEEWEQMPLYRPIQVDYYGWRIGIFGAFPNIVRFRSVFRQSLDI